MPVGNGPTEILPAGQAYRVTLLTGDVVTVTGRASGCPAVSVRPAKPSGTHYRSCGPDGHVRVVPAEVAGLLGRVLDEALFDVTTLIRQGYHDGASSDLPLIVRPGGAEARSAAALSADPLAKKLNRPRALPTIGAVAGRAPKRSGPELLRTLTARVPDHKQARQSADGPRVWLDKRVRASATTVAATAPAAAAAAPAGGTTPRRLDHNLVQVAAPQAWRSGYTGQGVRVAVLDTGADFNHPDLVGQVVARADFSTEGGDAVDRDGHGTHVASLIAGTGAAARGERRGVAPDADLLIGKVLGDDGFGSESQVIAGMEWAAPQADVVNMSLGGDEPSDGTDPMSLALDALSREHGTLFVVAAGNDGTYWPITAPAAAASALTVGAVDDQDRLADFSSRGPLVGSRAAKPELVAPGVEILAARAAGTTMGRPLDARYTAASGTSMATPHVAGAAALLAQRHPDWSGEQIKAALVGAAEPLPGADAYDVGAGRLHAARALSGAVAGQDVVDLGEIDPAGEPVETELSWTNTGSATAGLRLDVTLRNHDGKPVPSDAGTVSPQHLIVAPGGTGRATLRLDPARLAARPGLYTAVVTARSPDGRFVASTPVAFYLAPPSHELTLRVTPLPDPGPETDQWGGVRVVNIEDPSLYNEFHNLSPNEPVTITVPAGRYSIGGYQIEDDYATGRYRTALIGDLDVIVDRDTTMVTDLSQATPVRATVDGVPTEAAQVGMSYEQIAPNGRWISESFAFAWGEDARLWGVYSVPIAKPGIGEFDAYASFSLRAPGGGASPYRYDVVRALPDGVPADASYQVTAAEQARLVRIDQRFHRLDLSDPVSGGHSTTDHRRYGWSKHGSVVLEAWTDGVTGDRVDYLSPGYAWTDEAFYHGVLDYGVVTQEPNRRYAPGSRHTKVWVRQPLRPDWYDDPAPSFSACAPQPPHRSRGNLRVRLVEFVDQHQRFDCLTDWPGPWTELVTRELSLYRDGKLIGKRNASAGDFTIPPQAGTYRLVYDQDASALVPVSTRVSTAWTFRSAAPAGTGTAPLPLLSVGYALPLDDENHPTGGTATFTVRQAHGVAAQSITGFRLWTSLDDGATWQAVPVRAAGAGRFTADLPQPVAGQAVSLRVAASGSAGSKIEQTIIRAYRTSTTG